MSADRDLVAGAAQLVNLLNRRLAPVLERAGVTPQQWGVLSVIAGAESAMTPAAAARELAVTKQNMTGMVERLEQLGLIERIADPSDLRSSRLGLTRRGRTVIDKVRPAYGEWLESVAPEKELRQTERLINRLISRLEES
jgi:DNA-binding MarR family transcriptional regulator